MNFAFSSLVSHSVFILSHWYHVRSLLPCFPIIPLCYLARFSLVPRMLFLLCISLSLSSLVLYSCRYHSSLVPGAAVSRLPLNSLIARPFVIRTLLVPRLYAVRTPLVPRSRRVRISLTSLVLHRTWLVSHSHLPRILFVPRSYLTRFSVPTNYSRT